MDKKFNAIRRYEKRNKKSEGILNAELKDIVATILPRCRKEAKKYLNMSKGKNNIDLLCIAKYGDVFIRLGCVPRFYMVVSDFVCRYKDARGSPGNSFGQCMSFDLIGENIEFYKTLDAYHGAYYLFSVDEKKN